MPHWLGTLLGGLATAGVYALLRHLFPFSYDSSTPLPTPQAEGEYAKLDGMSVPLFFVIAAIGTYFWWQFFLLFASEGGFVVRDDTYSLRPRDLVYALPGMFLGMSIAGPMISSFQKRLLKEHYREFVAYQERIQRIPAAAAKPIYSFMFVASFVGVLAIADCYYVFGPTRITLNPFWGIGERSFPYADVASIRTAPQFIAPNGEIQPRRVWVVRFADSTTWDTAMEPSESEDDQLQTIVEAISERSGVAIVEVSTLMDADF